LFYNTYYFFRLQTAADLSRLRLLYMTNWIMGAEQFEVLRPS